MFLPEQVSAAFDQMLASPGTMTFWMLVVILLLHLCLRQGLQNGLERVTKVMMIALIPIMVVLAGNSLFMPGAKEGLRFYLVPDFAPYAGSRRGQNAGQCYEPGVLYLSLGIGAMAIFGSYIGREHSLLGESAQVVVLDTFVAITAGPIIFPACFTYGVDQTARPQPDLHHPAQYLCQYGRRALLGAACSSCLWSLQLCPLCWLCLRT